MAELRDDILKEEEREGGFNPGEPDDDTFLLQDKAYPGDIYQFIAKQMNNDDSSDIISSDERAEAENVQNFDNNSIHEPEEELFEYEKKKIIKDNTDDELKDPAFLGYIQGVMAVNKRITKPVDDSKVNDEEIIEKPFEPISDHNAQTSVVITDLDLDKPSTALINDKKISEDDIAARLKSKEKKADRKIDINDENNKENKKKRSLIPIFAAAALLVLLAALLMMYMPDKKEVKGSASSFKVKDNKPTIADKKIIITKKRENAINSSKDLDSNKTDDINIPNFSENKSQYDIYNNVETKIPANEVAKNTEVISDKNISENTVDKKIEISKKPEIVKPSVEKSTVKEKNVIDIPKPPKVKEAAKKTELAKKIETKPSNAKNNEKNQQPKIQKSSISDDYAVVHESKKSSEEYKKIMEEFSGNNDVPGVYIVQIYSSPSKEDAANWLNKLKNKNINDAFISEHTVRDRTWYRVRFGNFRTREEAKTAALQHGFAQTWIDRVK